MTKVIPPRPTTPLRDDECWQWFPRLETWVALVKEPDDARPWWPDAVLGYVSSAPVEVTVAPWPDLD